MNYSYIPQKFIENRPVYSNNQICPNCASNNSYPLMNMVGSLRYCNKCKNTFTPQISRYEKVVVEK
jgi:hypothetical protein